MVTTALSYSNSEARKILVKYLSKGKVVFFLGAGVSFGGGIPTANGILDALFNHIHLSETNQQLIKEAKLPFELIVEAIFHIYNGEEFIREFLRIFLKGEPSSAHQLVSELMKYGMSREVLTTNFDLLLEAILNEKKMSFNSYYGKGLGVKGGLGERSIYKLHGCASNQDSIITTMKSLSAHKESTDLNQVLTRVFSEDQLIVFIGYSFSDKFDILPQLERIEVKSPVLIIDHASSSAFLEKRIGDTLFGKYFVDGVHLEIETFRFLKEVYFEMFRKELIETRHTTNWKNYLFSLFTGVSEFLLLTAQFQLLQSAALFQQSLEVAHKMYDIASNHTEKGMSANRLSNIYRNEFRFSESKKYAGLSLKYALLLKSADGIASSFFSLGFLHSRLILNNMMHYDKASYYYLRGLDYAENEGEIDDKFTLLGNLGGLNNYMYEQFKDKIYLKKAIGFYTRAIIFEKRNPVLEFSSRAALYGNYGRVLLADGNLPDAEKYAIVSRDLYLSLGQRPGFLNAIKTLIRVEGKRFNYEKEYQYKKVFLLETQKLHGSTKAYFMEVYKRL